MTEKECEGCGRVTLGWIVIEMHTVCSVDCYWLHKDALEKKKKERD